MHWLQYILLFIIALVVTVATIPLVKRLAIRLDAIDYPDKRRVNTKPIPRLGGVSIYLGILASLIVFMIGVEFFGWSSPLEFRDAQGPNLPLVFLGITTIFGVGVVDDIFTLKAMPKFIAQIIAAIFVVAGGLLFDGFTNPFSYGYIDLGIFAYPITVFYLVAFANIINLIDGLDGLAAGITAITAMTIFVFAIGKNEIEAAFISITLIGSCLGFLRYNFNPASIFMGDSGALLLGFLLGVSSLFAVAKSALIVSLLVPIVTAGVPIIDTATAIIRRMRAGVSIGTPDKGHIHHRLLQSGFSQRTTVFIMWGWTLVLAVCSIFVTLLEPPGNIIAIIIALAVTVFAIFKLKLLGPVLTHHYNPRTRKDGSKEPEDDTQASRAKSGARKRKAANRTPRTRSSASARDARYTPSNRSSSANRRNGGTRNRSE
ncbi:MAG: undecaprenyl/decaprenyl-phosphate alpha-N-acetylglucosaminyl 1-phosphate transferase [Eggerthellaceae bacterium]|nr:undecaprenyl/decaprenyl-phosphate alpha-N-acetylglucosaminyl 1-phosphate transferase [Eggerthellaceae bacterium]